MNNSINYSGFVDIYLDSDDEFEPYGDVDTNEILEKIYNSIQTYKAEFNDSEYPYDT